MKMAAVSDEEMATSIALEVQKVDEPTTGRAPRCPTTISWQDLSYSVNVKDPETKQKGTKTILQPITGSVKPGELLAIMGPSGCGKTTLLDALGQRLCTGTVSGKVLFNDQTLNKVTDVLSYVAQEDTLQGVFTCRETLNFAGRFYFGYGSNSSEKIREVSENLILDMGLKSCADTIVGDIFRKGLSGGQKRRLSIAVELISNPPVVLLDEPTSGLDSASAFGVMKQLTKIASHDHTLICTIHQPSSEIWELFDKFLLLSRGNVMYFGKAFDAVEYFSSIGHPCPQYTNPADFMIKIVNTDFEGNNIDLKTLTKAYESSDLRKKFIEDKDQNEQPTAVLVVDGSTNDLNKAAIEDRPEVGNFAAFIALSHRNLLNNARNPGIIWVRFVMYVMLSLMIGLMYLNLGDDFTFQSVQSRISVLFFVAAFLVFMSVAVLPFFIQERMVFLRERANGAYSVLPYVVSNFVCTLPGLFLISLACTICCVLPSKLEGFGVFLAALFLSLVVAESFMSLISSIVPHYIVGIAVGAGLFGFGMLCEGFFIVKSEIPGWFIWGYYISFHTYVFRIFMTNEFAKIDESFTDGPFADGDAVLAHYGMSNVDIGVEMTYLIAYAVAHQALFGLVLYKWHTGKR